MQPEQHGRHLGAYLWLLVIITAFAVLAYLLHIGSTSPMRAVGSTPLTMPAPTASDVVTAQHGFQYLVQYTASGFHPQTLTVKKGETVRFTNNTAGVITVSGMKSTSSPLAHGQYWEFTAAAAGTSTFMSAGNSMTITAK